MNDTSFLHRLRSIVHHPQAENTAYTLAVIFLVFSLWLPPVSAGTRILHYDYPVVPKSGGAVMAPDGAQVLIPEGALTRQLRLKVTSLPASDFLSGDGDKVEDAAAEAMAADGLRPLGDVYRLRAHGSAPEEAVLTLPLVSDMSTAAADLYVWDGQNWEWASGHVIPEDQVIEARLVVLPSLAAAVLGPSHTPSIAAVLGAGATVPSQAVGILSQVNLEGFHVSADGTVNDILATTRGAVPEAYQVVAIVTNQQQGVAQSEVLTSILLTPEARSRHIEALTMLAVERMYAGVQLDYRGLEEALGSEYVTFLTELADALHKEGKLLSVRVELPRQIAEDNWDTGAYDWQALGAVADLVVVPAIESPLAYVPGGQMEALLRWAVGEVNRAKLRVALSVYAYQVSDGGVMRIPYLEALSQACHVAIEGGKDMVSPGESVRLLLPSFEASGGLEYHVDTATYWFAYQNAGGRDLQVWLENATSVAHKLELLTLYKLGGVTVEHLLDPQSDERLWDVLAQFRESLAPSMESDFAVVWTVEGPAGEEVTVAGDLRGGKGGAGETAVLASAASAVSAAANALTWQAPAEPGYYWVAASISDDGGRTTDVQSDSVSVQIPTPTPTPTPVPTPTPTPTPKPKQAVSAAAAPATRGPGFAFGIQGDALTDGDHGRLFGLVQQLGFKWYKQQVEWFRYNPGPGQYDWGPLDRIVDSANAAGINVLFSVVKAPKWARPPADTDEGPPSDAATYATFLREMAARYKGRVQAYEIWNEQNLYYEWGGLGGKLNAGKYVELLKAAYGAIKSVDTGTVVISGALTPTGYNDGNIAIDDRVYLEQMYQAGLKSYCDAVGAHPSGYNNPPDADWQTYKDPSATFNASGHPSWFYRGTLEGYRNIMAKYGDGAKRIWVTEFGWASTEGLGVPPARGYEYAADNTEMEQAQFIVRAYELARSWGWVGPMFLWNLNFGPICGCQDEKAAFGIIRPNWSMRPAFASLANMPK